MDPVIWQGILFGAFLAFYAFVGFEDMVNVAEEVRNPVRNVPLAILIALGVTTLLYAAVSLTAVLTVAPQQLAASDAPLATVYQQATGRKPVALSIISIFAVVNGALIQIIMGSRILYGMSRQGWLPALFGRVWQDTNAGRRNHRNRRRRAGAGAVAAAGHTGQVDEFPGAGHLQPDQSVVTAYQAA